MRTQVTDGKYEQAKELIAGPKYYPEERSKLVKLMNSGSLAYLLKDYSKALEFYRQALSLSDELYTTSIKAKAQTLVTNENLDLYYGANYERSYLRFYVALCNYHLYQNELDSKLARQFLQNARAAILDWDTFLNEIQYELAGRPTYKNDLAAKIFGAFIHQEIGTNGDLQIAKQLYKDAQQVLERQYSSYPAYNQQWKKYLDDYKKLPEISEQKLKTDYIVPTADQMNLLNYINSRQASLGKKNSVVPVALIIQQKLMAPKTPEKLKYPITVNFAASVAVSAGNNRVLSPFQFVSRILSVGAAAAPEIAFEYPMIPLRAESATHTLSIRQMGGTDISLKPALIAPLSQIAHQEAENEKIKNMAKAGARVAAKHAATLAGLYSTYVIAARQNEMAGALSLAAGMGSYALAAKQIAASELADLREWTLLPDTISIDYLELKKGKYQVVYDQKVVSEFSVEGTEKTKLVDLYLP